VIVKNLPPAYGTWGVSDSFMASGNGGKLCRTNLQLSPGKIPAANAREGFLFPDSLLCIIYKLVFCFALTHLRHSIENLISSIQNFPFFKELFCWQVVIAKESQRVPLNLLLLH
jgi:hypothetical protein